MLNGLELPLDTTAIRDAALRCRAVLMEALRAAGADPVRIETRQAAATHLLRAAARQMLRARGLDVAVLDQLLPFDPTARVGQERQGGVAGGTIFRAAVGGESSNIVSAIDAILNEPLLSEGWQPGNEESLGWFYQYFNEPDIAVFQGSRPPKVTADLLAAKTQLFTPRWIVRFLVENTLGRLWLQMHPDSRLADRLEYLVPPAKPLPSVVPKPVGEIRVLDPACGAMHFGLVVFDLLVRMYREELEHAGQPGWPGQPSVTDESAIPAAILANNLFGFDIDPLAVQLSATMLYLKAIPLSPGTPVVPLHLHCTDALRCAGGNSREESKRAGQATGNVLGVTYDVVVTNPPYLDSRDFDGPLRSFITGAYPAGKRNLYGAFLERCVAFLADGGRLGIITPQTFMFLSSFTRLRAILRGAVAVETLVQGGLGTFPDAVVDATFYVLRREADPEKRDDCLGTFFRLTRPSGTQAKRQAFEQAVAALRRGEADSRVFRCRQGDFDLLPGRPWVYWITPRVRGLFARLPRLREIARPTVGLQTSDNFRFLRFWWEVFFRDDPDDAVTANRYIGFGCKDRAAALATGRKWFPHIKGGDFRRWYGNQEYVVNWANDGAEIRTLGIESGKVASRPQNMDYYFRPGVTWTHTSSRGLSVRILPPGFICNVEGMAAFQLDGRGSSLETLAIMNSSFARHVIDLLNPTVHFGGREVGDLPYPQVDPSVVEVLESHVSRAIELARRECLEDETTWEFVGPPNWATGLDEVRRRRRDLAEIERVIDEQVYALYGLGREDRAAVEADLNGTLPAPPLVRGGAVESRRSRRDLAVRWISYAVGVVMGRFRPGVEGALGCGGFDARTAAGLRTLVISDGIAELSGDGQDDLAELVMRVLSMALGDRGAQEVVGHATGRHHDSIAGLRRYLAGGFFRDHLRRYQGRPIYWLVQSRGCGYSAYLYYERLSAATLERLRGPQHLADRLGEAIRRGDSSLAADLQAFDEAIGRILKALDEEGRAVGWRLEADDGVLINAASLTELLSPVWKDPAEYWRRLSAGEYDWSFTAARYWPQRVRRQRSAISSLALAHAATFR
ncbi:MAG: Eco57I restriction-modification methylase domain-containing protein [Phycisphaerae bacterium]